MSQIKPLLLLAFLALLATLAYAAPPKGQTITLAVPSETPVSILGQTVLPPDSNQVLSQDAADLPVINSEFAPPIAMAASASSGSPSAGSTSNPLPPDFKQDDSFKTSLFTGAFTYNYQIKVPPGTNGASPSLSLFYNHQKTNALPTLVGAGWELTQNYIEREFNHTLYNFSDDSFKLVLDGSEYELVYSQADGLFHTKIETYINIQNLSTSQNEKGTYWQVRTKGGKTYIFGSQNSSEMVSHTKLFTFRWYLDSVTDKHNSSIFYNYSENPFTNDTGITYPLSIRYNNDQTREVLFIYESQNRPDLWKFYDSSNILQISRRLSEIQVKANGNLVRKYSLAYIKLDFGGKSSLANITEYGSDGSALPPIKFKYNQPAGGWPTDSTFLLPWPLSQEGKGDIGTRLVDLNGDGLLDVITAWFNSAWTGWLSNYAFINTGSGFVEDPKWRMPWPVAQENYPYDLGTRFADVNGDGLVDVVVAQMSSLGLWGARYTYINTGPGWQLDPKWAMPYPFNQYGSGLDFGARLADVNGDGLVDVVTGRMNLQFSMWAANTTYINNGSGWFADLKWIVPYPFSQDGNYEDLSTRLTDVNGDGLPDLIVARMNSDWSAWWPPHKTYINNGSGWIDEPALALPWPISQAGRGDIGTRLADVNGDGLLDVINAWALAQGGWLSHYTYINNGTGWANDSRWYTPYPFAQEGITYDLGAQFGDINGDGAEDFIVGRMNSIWSGWAIRANYLNNGSRAFLMNSFNNSLGGMVSINYSQSTKANNTVNSTSRLPFNIWLVSSIITNNGMNGPAAINSSINYTYSGGFYSSRERDFKGFAVANVTLPDNSKETHYFHQENGKKGLEFKTEILDANKYPYLKNEFNFTSNFTNNYYIANLQEEKAYAYDGMYTNPRITSAAYTYDNYGNILQKTSYGDFSVSGDEKYENYEYVYNTSAWILDKPIYSSLKSSPSSPITSETKFYYDNLPYGSAPQKGDLTRKEDTLLGGTNPIYSFAYDSYGNLISQTDPNRHTTQIIYGITDPTFTFPEKTINAKAQTATSVYDFGTGNLLSQTDANGFSTSFEYDSFGRAIKEIQPYDSSAFPTKSYTYEFDGIAPEKVKISLREQNGTGNTYDSYSFYDGLGNLIQSKSEAENSQQIISDTFYDGLGRVRQKSNPYFAAFNENYSSPNSSAPFSQINYDTLSRPIRTTNPDSTFKSINYSKGNITMYDENGNKRLNVLDAYGQIKEVHEFNGTAEFITKYDYNIAGQLIQITDNENNPFLFTYDTLGRKISMLDPDLGAWTYSYDAAGNLISQTDARGITIEMEYDGLNRPIFRYSGSDLVFYNYDAQIFGTLSGLQTPAYSAEFSYDSRLRKTSETKTINYFPFTTTYSYDSLDRLTSMTLPDSEMILYSYNSQNQLSAIPGAISSISYNPFNKPISRSYANSLTTHMVYNSQNSRLTRILTSSLQDLNYQYDNAGNVLQISDGINPITQIMRYDSLDRLISASRSDNSAYNSSYNLTYIYSSIGNIMQVNGSSNLTYSYSSQHKHAVSNILAYGMPANSTNETLPLPVPTEVASALNSTEPSLIGILPTPFAISPSPEATLETSPSPGPSIVPSPTATTEPTPLTEPTPVPINETNSSEPIPTLQEMELSRSPKISSFDSSLLPANEYHSILLFSSDPYGPAEDVDCYDDVMPMSSSGSSSYNPCDPYSPGPAPTPAPAPGMNFLYDENGNMVSAPDYTYEYNGFNQLTKIKNASNNAIISEYLYDESGNRLMKTDHLKNETVFYISENFLQVQNATETFNTTYYFANGQMLARKDPDGSKFYYHPDHLGSTTLVTNETAGIAEETNYEPYGLPLYDANSRFLYTGKELDSESGLYYYGARYYDPEIARFIQSDTLLPDPYNPQMLNRYSYVVNNPYKYKDDSGHFITLPAAVVGAVAGGIIGGGLSLGAQLISNGGNINQVSWSDVGKSAAVGAVAGGVAGLTAGASLLATVGSGVVSGRAAQVADNALSGQSLDKNVLDPGAIGFDALTAGVAHGAGKYLSSTSKEISPLKSGGNLQKIDPMTAKVTENNAASFWYQGSFTDSKKSLDYHFSKYGTGMTKAQYTQQGFTKLSQFQSGSSGWKLVSNSQPLKGPVSYGYKIRNTQTNEFGIYTYYNYIVTHGK
ncbi:MAG: toxin TcdB middle/N-terminal domain-containing protein [Candidatus Micrarchaeota archaeon]